MDDSVAPRWLSEEEKQAWRALARMMIWLSSALDAQLQRDAGISHSDYQVLSWLSMSPGHTIRMSTLAESANVNLSHLSRIVTRLEKQDWVRRRPDPDDGRSTLACLTDAGWDKVVESAPGHAAAVRSLVFDNLRPEQVGQLTGIGEAVIDALRPGSGQPPATGDAS